MKRIHVLLAAVLCAGVQLIGGRQAQLVRAVGDETRSAVDEEVIWPASGFPLAMSMVLLPGMMARCGSAMWALPISVS